MHKAKEHNSLSYSLGRPGLSGLHRPTVSVPGLRSATVQVSVISLAGLIVTDSSSSVIVLRAHSTDTSKYFFYMCH